MKNVNKDKKYYLIRSIIVIGVYLLYQFIFGSIASMLKETDSIVICFIADVCFLAFILIIYKDKLVGDMNSYHKNVKSSKRILITAGWVLIIFIANIAGGYINSLITDFNKTDNNMALHSLPYIYVFFKTLIFSSIAEELVFKQSIKDVVDNNIIFIIVSTILYSTMNIAYTSATGFALIANIIPYALFAILSGILYIKYKNNIYVVMTIKVFYNLIPFAILLLGGVG